MFRPTSFRVLRRPLARWVSSAPKPLHIPLGALAFGTVLSGGLGYALGAFTNPSSIAQSPYGPTYATPSEVAKAIEELRLALPDEGSVSTDKDILSTYASSPNSYHGAHPHSVAIRVNSTEEVVKVVNIARKYKIPITPYSGGTSIEGHYTGREVPPGGICLDLSGMDKILHINVADSDMICQSGARWEDINQTLAEMGIPLFFPLDPGPGATLGGMVSTGCSGTNAVRYGTAKGEWFLNLTVVLPSGEVIKTRQRARKSSAGFDTTKLFIGAEGTLGIVTEVTIRLAPKLPTRVAVSQFPDVKSAISAVTEILNSPYGSHIQCVELLDDHMMKAISNSDPPSSSKKDRHPSLPVKDSLFFKFQGSAESMKEASKLVKKIVERHGSSFFKFAADGDEADQLWRWRKYALWSTLASVPGCRVWTTDVCVPVSNLPQLVQETKSDLAESGLLSTIVGHVGDGNFHALIIIRDDKELENVRGAVHRLVERAIGLDGTCTGEHGVGIGKKEYLVQELGQGTVDLMKTVKRAIDPFGLMNPGKLYPDEVVRNSSSK